MNKNKTSFLNIFNPKFSKKNYVVLNSLPIFFFFFTFVFFLGLMSLFIFNHNTNVINIKPVTWFSFNIFLVCLVFYLNAEDNNVLSSLTTKNTQKEQNDCVIYSCHDSSSFFFIGSTILVIGLLGPENVYEFEQKMLGAFFSFFCKPVTVFFVSLLSCSSEIEGTSPVIESQTDLHEKNYFYMDICKGRSIQSTHVYMSKSEFPKYSDYFDNQFNCEFCQLSNSISNNSEVHVLVKKKSFSSLENLNNDNKTTLHKVKEFCSKNEEVIVLIGTGIVIVLLIMYSSSGGSSGPSGFSPNPFPFKLVFPVDENFKIIAPLPPQ